MLKFMIIFSADSSLLNGMHAMHCKGWLKKRKSKNLEIDIFKFIFGVSFKKISNSSTNTTIFRERFSKPTNLFDFTFSFRNQISIWELAAHRLLSTEDSKESAFIRFASTWVARNKDFDGK